MEVCDVEGHCRLRTLSFGCCGHAKTWTGFNSDGMVDLIPGQLFRQNSSQAVYRFRGCAVEEKLNTVDDHDSRTIDQESRGDPLHRTDRVKL